MQRRSRLFALWFGCGLPLVFASPAFAQDDEDDVEPGPTIVNKGGAEVELRSFGRMVADDTIQTGGVLLTNDATPVSGPAAVPQVQTRGGNTQVNDPGLDNIQIFAGFRPFVEFTQSETSIAAVGQNIVATYNTSAFQPLAPVPGGLVFVHRFLSGYSSSTDGGKTWVSSFMPPLPGSIFTFGDPAIATDRTGNFYFAGLGADSAGRFTIQVNKSTNGGRTFGAAVLVQQDNGGDKEWIAVGKDPRVPGRDNVYVTWTSFQASGAQLRLGRSFDGGASFVSKTIFAPPADPDPTKPQNSLQFSNPVVDPITGRLYIPFIQFSNSDTDFIRVLASDDAGETFSFLTFNVVGAPSPTVLPVVQAGELVDGGSGGLRLAIHAGPALAGRVGLRQFVQTTRLVTQPAFAARNGALYLAWSQSTSPFFGDPTSGSNVLFIRSSNGGTSWSTPIQVNPASLSDIHHVLPALDISASGTSVHVGYFTQHGDESVDVDLANSQDRGTTFSVDRTVRLTSTPFVLPPTVIRLTAGPTPTTNYDRTIVSAYSLGEYLSVTAANGSVYVLWGDARNHVTEPVNPLSPISGQTHSQQDVFFQEVKAQ
jgi:hypothetical protein